MRIVEKKSSYTEISAYSVERKLIAAGHFNSDTAKISLSPLQLTGTNAEVAKELREFADGLMGIASKLRA